MTLPPLNPKEIALLQRPVPHDSRVHVQQARLNYRRAFVKWGREEDAMLRRLFLDGSSHNAISRTLERNDAGIKARLKKLGLVVIMPPKPLGTSAYPPPLTKVRVVPPKGTHPTPRVKPPPGPAATPRVQMAPVPPAPAPRVVALPGGVVRAVVSGQICLYCVASIPAGASLCPNCGASVAAVSSHRLAVGSKLQGGRYSVGKVLGEGGFGITYMGANVALRQQVAIKEFYPQGATRHAGGVIPPRGMNAQDFALERAKALDEARRVGRFHHPGIVKVSDVFEENGTAYIVMEYLNGESLEGRVARRGPLEPGLVAQIAEQLLLALDQIHGAGLLHRDIKPDNIMLNQDMLSQDATRAVLIDFGAAREFQTQAPQRHSLILTPGYAPLEQYGSHVKRSPSSDLYALGGTLYFALTGHAPPPATERVQGVTLTSLPEAVVQGALGLAEAITAALRIRVDERPQSAREMLERIRWKPRNAQAEPPAWLERLMRALKVR